MDFISARNMHVKINKKIKQKQKQKHLDDVADNITGWNSTCT